MKRITLVTPHFPPETNAAARRLSSLADGLASDGWRVTVVTLAPNNPQNAVYSGYGGRSPDIREEGGVRVVRLRPWIVRKTSIWLRMASEIWFCICAIPQILRARPRVIVATTPFIFLGPVGLIASWFARSRFAWDVRDLTWLYPRAAGKETFGLDRLLDKLMRWTASRSDVLTTATDGLLAYFTKLPSRSVVFANGVSDDWLEELLDLPSRTDDGRPVLMYAGLLGFNQHIETLLDVAALLSSWEVVIAGDGPERFELEARANHARLENVRFLGFLAPSELLEAYARADILVAQLRAAPVHQWSQPSKLWEYLATGRPVIYGGEGDAVAVLKEYGIAITVAPEDASAFSVAIRRLSADPELMRSLGAAGREFVKKHRRRSKQVRQIVDMLNGLHGDTRVDAISIEQRRSKNRAR